MGAASAPGPRPARRHTDNLGEGRSAPLSSTTPYQAEETPPQRTDAQWFRGVLVALITGAGVGILLGFVSMLPFFLGLFFFLLLGLVPGAVLFRFGHPVRPIPRLPLWVGIILVLMTTWLVSGYVEYLSLPGHVAVKVRRNIPDFPEGYTREKLNDYFAEFVHDDLKKRYGYAGMIGYVQWAADSGRMVVPPGVIRLAGGDTESPEDDVNLNMPVKTVYVLPQPAALWLIRVGFSLPLLALAIVMQVAPLRHPAPPPEEDEEAEQEDQPATAQEAPSAKDES